MSRENNAIECDYFYCPDQEWLRRVWLELEQRAEPNVFLSWLWIGSWFSCFVHEYYVIEARKNNCIVGLGIVVLKTDTYSGYLYDTSCYLHRVGDEMRDQAWIEFNDFLMLAGQEDEIRTEMIALVMAELVGNGKFVIGASRSGILKGSENEYGIELTWDTLTYKVDLKQLRKQDKALTQLISRSARYQISRSLRRYQDYGEVTISTAESVEDALAYFALAAPLHVKRWGDKAGQSGFKNPHFIEFHKTIIQRGVVDGNVRLHKIVAGDELIAIMYNFHWHGNVTFYLSALNYDIRGEHLKPGLVSHYLLINMAMEEGYHCYDFMGGVSRYKQTFSNVTSSLSVYEMSNSKYVIEWKNTLRNIRSKLSEYL